MRDTINTGGETSDDYANVVVSIDARHRIIRCAANLQYIAQRRREGRGRWPWHAIGYITSAKGATRLPAPFHAPALGLFDTPEPALDHQPKGSDE